MKRKREALVNRNNWKATRAYLEYREAVHLDAPGTVEMYRLALDSLLLWAQKVRFKVAHQIRPTYPQFLLGKAHSPVYTRKQLGMSRDFFKWLRLHDERYADLSLNWIDTLRVKRDGEGMMQERELFTLDDVQALLDVPAASLIERRDRAAVAFLFLSGMRGGAFTSMPVKAVHFDHYPPLVQQWPALGVRTKNSKAKNTYLLVGEDMEPLHAVVREWHHEVERHVGPDGMWYALMNSRGDTFAGPGTPGRHRVSNLNLRLKRLCELAKVPEMSPHKLRHGHAVWALKQCTTMEEYKAVSQNLMHESVLTTDSIYGVLQGADVGAVIARLGAREASTGAPVATLAEMPAGLDDVALSPQVLHQVKTALSQVFAEAR